MVKINKFIALVRTSNPNSMSIGVKTSISIKRILSQYYAPVKIFTINNINELEDLVLLQPDLVFLGLKQLPLENGSATKVWASAYLDSRGINYTGSTAAAIALDFDKSMAKKAVVAANLKTSDYFVSIPGEYNSAQELPLAFPLFIKPLSAGHGKGIGADSVVRDFAGYKNKVSSIKARFNTSALVETYLTGREFSVGILVSADTAQTNVMPIELITQQNMNGDRILGEDIKSADTETVKAVPDGALKESIKELALKVFELFGARDFGRIDIRLDEQGVPYFLEANLIPGLAEHDFTSYFISACAINLSMSHEDIILAIVNAAQSRQPEPAKVAFLSDIPNTPLLPGLDLPLEPAADLLNI